ACGRLDVRVGGGAGRARPVLPRARGGGQRAAGRPGLEPRRLREQRRADGARDRYVLSVSATAANATASAAITTSPPYREALMTRSLLRPVPPTVGGAADGGIPQPGGLSTANWSVISSRLDRKR